MAETAAHPPSVWSEDERCRQLRDAEDRASALFDEVIARGLLAPGVSESQASAAITALAHDLFGVRRHWHKRIVRAGANTLMPYRQNPPDRELTADDIAFLDSGPVFGEWEADFGRTYVLGDDPAKHRLAADLSVVWAAGKEHFEASPGITGEQLFEHMVGLAAARGWEWGGPIAGHLVGHFPHDRIPGPHRLSDIMPGATEPMRRTDAAGNRCHWILEVHLVDRDRGIGGFFEQLLDVP